MQDGLRRKTLLKEKIYELETLEKKSKAEAILQDALTRNGYDTGENIPNFLEFDN